MSKEHTYPCEGETCPLCYLDGEIAKLVPLYAAVKQYKIDFDSDSMEAEINSRSKVFDVLAEITGDKNG